MPQIQKRALPLRKRCNHHCCLRRAAGIRFPVKVDHGSHVQIKLSVRKPVRAVELIPQPVAEVTGRCSRDRLIQKRGGEPLHLRPECRSVDSRRTAERADEIETGMRLKPEAVPGRSRSEQTRSGGNPFPVFHRPTVDAVSFF